MFRLDQNVCCKQAEQNVCPHSSVRGSVKFSPHIEHSAFVVALLREYLSTGTTENS